MKRPSIRMPDRLHSRLVALAELKGVTLNDLMIRYLERAAEADGGDDALREATLARIERMKRDAGLD